MEDGILNWVYIFSDQNTFIYDLGSGHVFKAVFSDGRSYIFLYWVLVLESRKSIRG